MIHAFDYDSCLFARVVAHLTRRPCILTKCGGSNPKVHWPHTSSLIVWSRENLAFFQAHRKFRRTSIHFLPNRVGVIVPDTQRLRKLAETLNLEPSRLTVLRIARFSASYRESFLQSVNLVKRLNQDGHCCQLVLLGVPQDASILETIMYLCDDRIKVVTQEEYTLNASALVDLADIVVGTGRGLMEAASRGKTLMVPVAGYTYPVLVTPDLFERLSNYNFSSRAVLDDYDEEQTIMKMAQLLSDAQAQRDLEQWSWMWYHNYFAIGSVVEKYCSIYESLSRDSRTHLLDLAVHMVLCVRNFLRSRPGRGGLQSKVREALNVC